MTMTMDLDYLGLSRDMYVLPEVGLSAGFTPSTRNFELRSTRAKVASTSTYIQAMYIRLFFSGPARCSCNFGPSSVNAEKKSEPLVNAENGAIR
jgi:hypothetical protein